VAGSFVIGMALNATANVGAAMSGVSRVGSALDALSRRRLSVETDLRPFRETEAALAQVDRRIGALNARKLQLQQQLAGAPEKAGEVQAALDKVGGRLDRLNAKRVQLAAELEKGRTAASGLERELGRVTAASERLGSSMAAMKARADLRREIQGNILGTVAMGAALAAPVKQAIDFESAMADVRKAADLDPTGVRQMGDAILQLSRRVPVAATGLATIMAEAGRAGIAREELLGFAEDTARLAVAFDTTAEQAGPAMVGLRSIFKLNREQISAVGDAYNELDNNMAAVAKDMLEIANRSGSTARLFGLDAVQLGALGAALLELKTPPEISARAINGMLMKLKTATSQGKEFQAALQSIGLSAQGMEDAIKRDAEGALVLFLKHAKAAENPLAVLTDVMGQGFADEIGKLVDSVDVYEKAIGIVSDKTKLAGSMQREYQNRLDTTANELQLLRNELTRAASSCRGRDWRPKA
jgi:TP901 family phage tail tape measure protein